MTADQLFQWLRDHRAPDTRCSRCGLEQLAFYRDHAERPVGTCCVRRATATAEEARMRRVVTRRLHEYAGHQCVAEGCQECMEAGL